MAEKLKSPLLLWVLMGVIVVLQILTLIVVIALFKKVNTPIPVATVVNTPTPLIVIATNTSTPTAPATNTPTPTATITNTPIPTATHTNTPIPTETDTATPTPIPVTVTNTLTPTIAATKTPTPTVPPATLKPGRTPTLTPTFTPSPPSSSVSICRTDFQCALVNGACKDLILVQPARLVSRIYISMTQRGSIYGYSLWEVRAFNGANNVAPGGTAKASPAEGLSFDGCVEDKERCAIDNNMTTRWGSDYLRHGDESQWFEITFASPVLIDRIELEWETAYAKAYCVIIE